MRKLQLSRRIRRSLGNRGVLGTIRHYTYRVYRIVRPYRVPPHPFDLQHGVHTSAHILGSDLAVGHANDIYNTTYLPSHPSMVSQPIEAWDRSLATSRLTLEDFIFIDIGAGMGRAVMVASAYPFKQIVGVEMNPGLSEQARRNLDVWLRTPRACSDLRIATTDAAEFAWPRSPIVLYLFNPFEDPVLRQLLSSLENAVADGTGPVNILYIYPAFASCFEEHPWVHLISTGQAYLSPEERAIDPYNDPTAESYTVPFRIYGLSTDSRSGH